MSRVDNTTTLPSRVVSAVARAASSAERSSRFVANPAQGDRILSSFSTFEHTAGPSTRRRFSPSRVTRSLMTNWGITAPSILRVALPGRVEIELDPARQEGKGGLAHGQKGTGLPAWEDSSSSREEPAIPHCGAEPVPRVPVARRRGTPAPSDRSRSYLRKQSSPYIRTVQHTVLFVLGLNSAAWHFLIDYFRDQG